MKAYTVYILASKAGVLYVGVTNDLCRRLHEHQANAVPGFTSRYRVHSLVWYAVYADVREAIAREKQIKGWRREKKLTLIETTNPGWEDLGADLNA